MSDLMNSVGWLQANILNLFYVVVIVAAAVYLSKFIRKLILGLAARSERLDDTLAHFFGSLASYAVLAFAGLIVLDRFGIQTASLVALLGAAGLAIGLALQGTLSSLAAGVMLILFRPFKVGDFIETGGTFGKVDALTLFTTEVSTFDNQQIIIPNGEIWGAKIVNHSHFEHRGVDMIVSVAYGTDLDVAKKAILKVLKSVKCVVKDPAPFVEVETLAGSSVDFMVRPFVKNEDYFELRYDFPELIYKEFNKQGIEIPFQQIVVHNPGA